MVRRATVAGALLRGRAADRHYPNRLARYALRSGGQPLRRQRGHRVLRDDDLVCATWLAGGPLRAGAALAWRQTWRPRLALPGECATVPHRLLRRDEGGRSGRADESTLHRAR